MRRFLAAGAAFAVVLATAPTAVAQSLGELAQREADRRAKVREPGKVYTNSDLIPDFTTPPSPEPDASADAPASAPASDTANASPSGGTTAASDVAAADSVTSTAESVEATPIDEPEAQRPSDRGEPYWRDRAALIRSRLADKTREIEVLRVRLASLDAAPENPERSIASRALSRAVSDLDAFNQEWLRFERLARESGVPEAWIR